MTSIEYSAVAEEWAQLALYRERYDIEDRLAELGSLERSMARRQERMTTESVRLRELERQLADARTKIKALERELTGSRRTGALLIREILDRVRAENGEAWSPAPIRGFRAWSLQGNRLQGSQVPWTSPSFEATCLRKIRNVDIPHSGQICGPPACGVYATKQADMFPMIVRGGLAEDSAFGVVAVSGKVIEHTLGYRAARAAVVAISIRLEGRWLATAVPEEIAALFDDPAGTVADRGKSGYASPFRVENFLEHWKRKDETWISDLKSA